jgi:nucleotide-binding universal stress UspA family protein
VFGIARLIVGTSGSPGSLQALRYGEGLARTHHAALIPVIAWELPGGDRSYRISGSRELGKACQEIASRQLRDALIAVWGQLPDDPLVQPRVERGPAGWVLVNLTCRPDDVLVVGAGRRSPLGRLACSRSAATAQTHAQCPVMAAPPPDLVREFGHGRLARVLWRRSLTPEQVLGDKGRPAA